MFPALLRATAAKRKKHFFFAASASADICLIRTQVAYQALKPVSFTKTGFSFLEMVSPSKLKQGKTISAPLKGCFMPLGMTAKSFG
jgi:hypothetical protein